MLLKKPKIEAFISTIIFYIVIFLMVAEDIAAIRVKASEIDRIYVGGVPLRDIGLVFVICYIIFNAKAINKVRIARFVGKYIYCFILLLSLGYYNIGEFSNIMNADIRLLFWLIGGIGLGFLLVKTNALLVHLGVVLILFVTCMNAASLLTDDFMIYTANGLTRVTHPSTYRFLYFNLVLVVLFSNLSPPRIQAKWLVWYTLGSIIIVPVILGETRSALIALAMSGLLVYQSFRIESTSADGRGYLKKGLIGIIISIAVIITVNLSNKASYGINESRKDRFASLLDPRELLNNSRIHEAIAFFDYSSDAEVILGRGIGGTVISPTYSYYPVVALHIGILNFWLKAGIVGFFGAVIYLYIVLPRRYYNSWKKRVSNQVSNIDYSNIYVLSAVFPWLTILPISGGFDEGSSSCVGLLLYLHAYVSKYGISALLHPSYLSRS